VRANRNEYYQEKRRKDQHNVRWLILFLALHHKENPLLTLVHRREQARAQYRIEYARSEKRLAALRAARRAWPEEKRRAAQEWHRKYVLERKKTDPIFAVADRFRSRTKGAFQYFGYKKTSRSAKLLGCSWEFLKQYIEVRFEPGMTWANQEVV
jgi:hypothetical protein